MTTRTVKRVALADAMRDRLYFAQVREDARAELAALRPTIADRVVVVSSGGCTALALCFGAVSSGAPLSPRRQVSDRAKASARAAAADHILFGSLKSLRHYGQATAGR